MSLEKKTPVWFLGTSPFAVPSLEALVADSSFSVDLVITQPDRPVGRKQELTTTPVKTIADKYELRILQPENLNSQFSILHSQFDRPNFLIVVSFGQILSQEILDLPTIAPVNVHASLLPRFRGASPIHHAILAGDTETGVTIQKMVKELDAGPILAQENVPINARETVTTLHEKLASIGAKLLLETLKNPLHPVPQDESRKTVCHKLKRKDGEVDPRTMTAQEIDRKVRGLTPWPGVSIILPQMKVPLKLLKTSLEATGDSTPLPCANGSTLHLAQVQPSGGTVMSGTEWKRGQQ